MKMILAGWNARRVWLQNHARKSGPGEKEFLDEYLRAMNISVLFQDFEMDEEGAE